MWRGGEVRERDLPERRRHVVVGSLNLASLYVRLRAATTDNEPVCMNHSPHDYGRRGLRLTPSFRSPCSIQQESPNTRRQSLEPSVLAKLEGTGACLRGFVEVLSCKVDYSIFYV